MPHYDGSDAIDLIQTYQRLTMRSCPNIAAADVVVGVIGAAAVVVYREFAPPRRREKMIIQRACSDPRPGHVEGDLKRPRIDGHGRRDVMMAQ